MGRNNFLARLPRPSPGISDIPSANVLIRKETSSFHRAIFHAITSPSVGAGSGEERPVEGASWGLFWRVEKGPGLGDWEERTGRKLSRNGRKDPPLPHRPRTFICHCWACWVGMVRLGWD